MSDRRGTVARKRPGSGTAQRIDIGPFGPWVASAGAAVGTAKHPAMARRVTWEDLDVPGLSYTVELGGKTWLIEDVEEIPPIWAPVRGPQFPWHELRPGKGFRVTMDDMPDKTPEQIQRAVQHSFHKWRKRNAFAAEWTVVTRQVVDPRTQQFTHALAVRTV